MGYSDGSDYSNYLGQLMPPWVVGVLTTVGKGVLDRTEGGQIVFPFEAVKVEFLLQAA